MNARSVWQRLWWKEMRQLIPLAVLLALLVILLLGLQALTAAGYPAGVLRSTTVALCFGMPGLFACGVGAVLVGYEKDSRTLRWLANLPVPPRWIVRVKFLAALACLAGLWAVSALILAVVAVSDVYPFTTDLTGGWIAPAFSVFLLFAGFALAWRIPSALTGLLLVIPIASLPLLLAGSINAWVWPAERDPFSPAASYTQLACIGLGIVLAVWFTERFGARALAAQAAEANTLSGFFTAQRGLFGARRIATASIRPPLSALVWQFACQSRAWLAGHLLMLAVAVVLLAPAARANHLMGPAVLGLFLLVLSSSWLGAMVFQSDMLQGRIRFLSDRGISPAATWLTRQAVPACLLALACLALPLAGGVTWAAAERQPHAVAAPSGMMLLLAVTAYLFTQWLGQVLSSPIIAAIAAPLVALGAISYGGFAIEMLGTPWWQLGIVMWLPAIATGLMTRRWMDRRLGFGFWIRHAGLLAAAILLPAAPMLVALLRQPAMPQPIARQLRAAAERAGPYDARLLELVAGDARSLQPPATSAAGDAGSMQPPATDAGSPPADFLQRLDRQLRLSHQPISASSGRVIEQVRSEATLARMALDALAARDAVAASGAGAAPAGAAAAIDEHTRRYRQACELLVRVAQRLRSSPRLIEQDVADRVEIWLLRELLRETARQRLGPELHEATARLLADPQARRAARLRAVALSWREFQDGSDRSTTASLGGYHHPRPSPDRGTLARSWLEQRRVGLAVADLWELAQGGTDAAAPERLRRIANCWGAPESDYGFGPLGAYQRADDLDRFLDPPLSYPLRSVANQWRADWEHTAARRFGGSRSDAR